MPKTSKLAVVADKRLSNIMKIYFMIQFLPVFALSFIHFYFKNYKLHQILYINYLLTQI